MNCESHLVGQFRLNPGPSGPYADIIPNFSCVYEQKALVDISGKLKVYRTGDFI